MRITTILTAIILMMSCILLPVCADKGNGNIELSSTRPSLPSDGKSIATISARVRDRDGQLVSDGTEVQFSASLGIIEERALTSAGVARVKLVSSEISGKSIITASWLEGGAVAQITINFSPGATRETEKRYMTIKARGYMAYAIDMKVMDASGGAVVTFKGLTIDAYSIQIDTLKNRLVARGQGRDKPVRLTFGKDTIVGEMFSCDLMATTGLLISAERGGVEVVDFSSQKITAAKAQATYPPESFDLVDLSESLVLVRTKEAIIYPGEKIYFKRAGMYPGGKRLITLPYYALSLTGYQVDGAQYVGYSSSGISLSLPYYYSLTPSSSGALLLRYGNRAGWSQYGQVPGWFIDLRHDYSTEHSQGSLVFNEITSKEWGAHYSHNQSIGKSTQTNFFVDYPAHKDLFGSFNVSRSFKGFSLGLDLDGSRDRYQNSSITHNLTMQTRSRRIGKSFLSYNVTGSTSQSRSTWRDAGSNTFTAATTAQRVNTNLTTAPIPLGKSLKLRSSLGLGYLWQNSTDNRNDIEGLSTIGSSVLDWKITPQNNMQLSYRYIQRPTFSRSFQFGQTVDTRPANQSLSANWRFGKPGKWSVSIYGIKGLDFPNMSLFGDLSYQLHPQWRLGLRMTANKYRTRVFENGEFVNKDLSYSDVELILGKKIGSQEVSAVWSQSQGKILLELGSGFF